jgi:hypothetical protein
VDCKNPENHIGKYCWADIHTKYGWQRKEFVIDKEFVGGFRQGLIRDVEIQEDK